jgi:hypothetical protein
MTLLLESLRAFHDPGWQRKNLLKLNEFRKYLAVCPVGEKTWGKPPAWVINPHLVGDTLPGNPREAFGILGSKDSSESLLLEKEVSSKSFPPKRRIGVGTRDKGQREKISVRGEPHWTEVFLASRSKLEFGEELDFRYTEPIILPEGF